MESLAADMPAGTPLPAVHPDPPTSHGAVRTLGKYHISGLLHRSARTVVYRAHDPAGARGVVLKCRPLFGAPGALTELEREYHVLRRAAGAGAIPALDFFVEHDLACLVLEDGGEALARRPPPSGVAGFLRLAVRAAEAVQRLHDQGIRHGRLCPGHLVWDDPSGVLHLIDLGSAHDGRPQPGAPLGEAAAYAAPEQTGRMGRAPDHRSDLYALGATFYHVLAGHPPFEDGTLPAMVHSQLVREPAPLHERCGVPEPLSRLVARLLAKEPDLRYQSARGLRADLEACREQWQREGRLTLAELGRHDVPLRLEAPLRLYGRDREEAALARALDAATAGGALGVLLAGPSGAGKTRLAWSLRRPLGRLKGCFCAGKADPLLRDQPYAPFVQALEGWVHQWLCEPERGQLRVRRRLTEALGGQEGLVVRMVPAFTHVLGEVPPPPPVPASEERKRLHHALHRLLAACAGPERPLVLFLDDLQWIDAASLELLEHLLTEGGLGHFLFVGTYRDGEVDPGHALARLLRRLEAQAAPVHVLPVAPLDPDAVRQFVAETVRRPPGEVGALAALCSARTNGNPFFLGRFLHDLHQRQVIRLGDDGWCWDVRELHACAATDNVADLLVHALGELPGPARQLLPLAACAGDPFEAELVARASGLGLDLRDALQPAVQAELIVPLDPVSGGQGPAERYRFAHDRVRLAALSLLTDDARAQAHLRLGHLLLAGARGDDRLAERIFTVVGQLNLAAPLLGATDERRALARLNLQAGRQAKATGAYGPAFDYLRRGYHLLRPEDWEAAYALAFDLSLAAARAAALCADAPAAHAILDEVWPHARSVEDRASVLEVRVEATFGESPERALAFASEALRLLGVALPEAPDANVLAAERAALDALLAGRPVEALAELPPMADPRARQVMRLTTATMAPAYNARPALVPVLAFRQVACGLRYGTAPESAFAYASCGMALCGLFDDPEQGYRFGMLALDVLERVPESLYRSRALHLVNAMIRHWKEPLRRSLEPLRAAHRIGLDAGDWTWAAIPLHVHGVFSYLAGVELTALEEDLAEAAAFLRKHNTTCDGFQRPVHQAVLNLMGRSAEPTVLAGAAYDEAHPAALHRRPPDQTTAFVFHFVKAQLHYWFGSYPEALAHWEAALGLVDSAMALPYVSAAAFFGTLTRLALCDTAAPDARERLLRAAAADEQRLERWQALAPDNHTHRLLLVQAERLRVLGETRAAHERYEAAVAAAQQAAFVHEEALARECLGRFLLATRRFELGHYYLRTAAAGYRRWGAEAKARHLEAAFPHSDAGGGSRAGDDETLDVSGLLQGLRVIAQEVDEAALLERILQILLQNAGAQRGCLLLQRKGVLHLAAEGMVDPDRVTLLETLLPLDGAQEEPPVCAELVRFVARTRRPLLVDDMLNDPRFAETSYVARRRPRSVLCTPLLHQDRLLGVAYLENNRTRCAFTPARVRVLDAIGTQAAVSWGTLRLQNARARSLQRAVDARTRTLRRLKRLLEQANERLRRAVEQNEEFLGVAAHDLRNPLSGVIGFGEVLLETVDDPQAREMIADLLSGAGHMRAILDELMASQALEQEAALVERERVCLKTLADTVVRWNAAHAEGKGITVHVEAAPGLYAFVDAAQMQRVLDNLVSNAVKYSEPGHPVWIRVRETERELVLTVEDEGPGLTPHDLHRAFAKLQRLSAQPTGGETSVGLGLYIARLLVEQHGGRVTAGNRPGGGACFTVALPRTGPV